MADDLDTLRDACGALARGDVPAFLAALAPDVSWTEAEGFPYGGTYSGPEAVLENVFMRLGTEWEGFSAVPREFVVQGDTVAALGQYSGTHEITSKRFSAPCTDTAVVQNALR